MPARHQPQPDGRQGIGVVVLHVLRPQTDLGTGVEFGKLRSNLVVTYKINYQWRGGTEGEGGIEARGSRQTCIPIPWERVRLGEELGTYGVRDGCMDGFRRPRSRWIRYIGRSLYPVCPVTLYPSLGVRLVGASIHPSIMEYLQVVSYPSDLM